MPAFSSSVFLLPSLYFTYKCQNSLISLLASKTHVWICIITESSVFYQKNSIVYFHILFLFASKSKDVFMLVNQTDLSVMKHSLRCCLLTRIATFLLPAGNDPLK